MSKISTFAGRVLLVRTGEAIGDALLLTAVADEISKKYPDIDISAMSRFPCLYNNNPHIKRNFSLPRSFPSRLAPYLKLPGVYFLGYEFDEFPPTDHLATVFCHSAGLSPKALPRPKIYFSENEIIESTRRFCLPSQFVTIQSTAGSSWAARNKDWHPTKWCGVVDQLESECTFVQIGLSSDPKLPHATDLRGKTSLREVACVIERSSCFVGQEGGLHHMAAAVATPSVLVFSGYIAPETTSYPENTDIYHGAECAPCWLTTPCPSQKKCMSSISVDEVVGAIRAMQH